MSIRQMSRNVCVRADEARRKGVTTVQRLETLCKGVWGWVGQLGRRARTRGREGGSMCVRVCVE